MPLLSNQEVHKDCFIGDFCEGQKTQTRFPRNSDVEYNPENGSYRHEKCALQVKYTKQCRFSFGVAIQDKEGEEEGRRLAPYNYTGKNTITIKKEEAAIKAEIARVKTLARNSSMWTSILYINYPVTKIKGVSVKKKELLE